MDNRSARNQGLLPERFTKRGATKRVAASSNQKPTAKRPALEDVKNTGQGSKISVLAAKAGLVKDRKGKSTKPTTRAAKASGVKVAGGKVKASAKLSETSGQSLSSTLPFQDAKDTLSSQEPSQESQSSRGSQEPSQGSQSSTVSCVTSSKANSQVTKPVLNYVDVDKEADYFYSPIYSEDIFKYHMSREEKFCLTSFLSSQTQVTSHMRSILVDWLVELQEHFELNHEILYLAVKLIDHYLDQKDTRKDTLQLLGAAAMFVSIKYDERIPPPMDELLDLCDKAYTRSQFITMEQDVLRVVNFDLGMPLSYRFLRRFARCARTDLELLTLARYILETSLLSYPLAQVKDSLLAAASLWLAMQMCKDPEFVWDDTLVYYSGYKEHELLETAEELNDLNAAFQNGELLQLMTVYNKYSHDVFFKVASDHLSLEPHDMKKLALNVRNKR